MNILAALKGKKTYISSAITIVAAIAGVLTKTVSPLEAASAIGIATGLSTNRAGSKDDANAVIANVHEVATSAAALAPLASALVPGSAATIGELGALAGELGKATAPAPAA